MAMTAFQKAMASGKVDVDPDKLKRVGIAQMGSQMSNANSAAAQATAAAVKNAAGTAAGAVNPAAAKANAAKAMAQANTPEQKYLASYMGGAVNPDTPPLDNIQPAASKDYLMFGNPDAGFKSGMSAEDQASWSAIGKKYAAGDKSWNSDTDSFREDGNWSSFYDADGNINGWLYAGNGMGGYAPVFSGKVGETGYKPGTVFFSPDGKAYTMGDDGSLSQSGNVEWARYGSYVGPKTGYQDSSFWALDENGNYKKYTNQTAPDSVLEAQGYFRDDSGLVRPINNDYYIAKGIQNGQITPYQAELAKKVSGTLRTPNGSTKVRDALNGVPNGGSVYPSGGGSGSTYPSGGNGGGNSYPSGGGNNYPSGEGAPRNAFQSYLDQWDYGEAPEWEGSPYKEKRDKSLEEAQNMQYADDEYRKKRDELTEQSLQAYGGSQYDPLRDEYLQRYSEEWDGSDYQQKRNEHLQNAGNMKFNYNPETDPVWQALQKQYRREGDRATRQTMGQAAAMTGGVPSSYAATAAAMAGNNYAAQLSDRLPQVYQDSYQRYLQEFQKQLGISDQYQGFDDREYSRWADQQGKNLDLADRYNQYGQQDYDQYRDRVSQQLSGADRYNGYDQTEYQRYLDEYGQQLDAADRYQGYGAQEYDRYRDRLGQWNTDRNFQYGLNRDAVEDARYADETAYSRNYRAQRDAVEDQRYDQQWAQQLREYADAQGWKQAEWQQYLREYGDQLSEKERQWAYQMARDAVEDNRWERQYADSRGDTAYERALRENELAYDRAWNEENRDYTRAWNEDERDYDRGWDTTKWNQALREYDDEQAQQAWNNDYKLSGRSSGGSYSGGGYSGGSSGGSKSSDTPAPASGGAQYDASGRRTGTWQDSDGYTYNGYHPDGQWKSQGYDAAWSSIQALAKSGASKETVLTRIRSLVAQDRITDYEAEMMLVSLGYRTTSPSVGRNSIGPNNVQMVQ